MFNFMGTFGPPVGPFYLKAGYDLAFSINIASTDSWLYSWFNEVFGITFEEIEIEPGVNVEVAFWNIAFYVDFNLFKLSPEYACPLPCPYTTGPFTLPP